VSWGSSVGWFRPLFFAFIGFLIACGDDDGDRRTVSKKGCDIEQTECDVEQTSCLESLLELTACARGDDDDEATLPEVHRITTAEFTQRLRDEAEESGYSTSPWDQLLPRLSLQPEGLSSVDSAVDVLAGSVLAFYDDETKDITILTDSRADDPQQKMYVVMHEFTHYLQGRDNDFVDLRKRAGAGSDAHAALNALIEGEATVNSTRGLVYLANRAPHTLDWLSFYDSLEENLVDSVEESESPLYAAIQLLPYGAGARFVGELWDADDRSAVTELFDEWPHALRDWMMGPPWKVGSTTQKPLDCAPPLAPEGFSLYEVDSLGSAGAFALLAAAGSGDLALAKALQNDAFAVYLDETQASDPQTAKRVAGVWRLRFDDGAVARFSRAIASLGLDTKTFKNELVIRVVSDESIDVLSGDALEACPKLSELKPMRSEPSLPNAIRQLWN
jgi:hypothetical protein